MLGDAGEQVELGVKSLAVTWGKSCKLLCFLLEYVTFLTVTPNLTSIYIINRRPLFTHLGELARPRSLRAQPRGVLPSDATCKFEGPSNALGWGIHQVDPQNSESC